MQDYTYGDIVADRIRELHEEAARQRLAQAARVPREPIRLCLGNLLIAAGRWVGGCQEALAPEPAPQVRFSG